MKRSSQLLWTVAALAAPLAALACASIMHGKSQDVNIASQPSGASVTVDNQALGMTPVVAKLKRKDKHVITVKMDGYQPFEMTTTRSTSGWVWGNVVFGGLIGLAVDLGGGCAYNSGAKGGGLTAALKLGGTPSPRVRLGGEVNVWTKDMNGVTESVGNISAAAYLYPTARSGFFVKGGVGVASFQLSQGSST